MYDLKSLFMGGGSAQEGVKWMWPSCAEPRIQGMDGGGAGVSVDGGGFGGFLGVDGVCFGGFDASFADILSF